MTEHIEHFLYGSPAKLRKLRAALPEGLSVIPSLEGIILREPVSEGQDFDAAIARIEALAQKLGVEYDGHGQSMDGADGRGEAAASGSKGIDLLIEPFAQRTGIQAGHGFALPLPDGRFGHGVFLGQDKAYLLLDISALVTDAPATPNNLRKAPMRYRQPILVWHTAFDALPLAPVTPIAPLPRGAEFRMNLDTAPQHDTSEVFHLGMRFGITETDSPAGWDALLVAMAAAGERLPWVTTYTSWEASIGKTGKMKQRQLLDTQCYHEGQLAPMPWQPAKIDMVLAALMGGNDIIAVCDFVRA